jgi:hypothetical protein
MQFVGRQGERMRKLFPGYFTPTEQEFTELWREATFAFDANVLLGLYRLTAESRQVFFDVLQRLGDRIFLPNQAAYEYLRNRLGAISARSRSHEGVKADAAKFVESVKAKVEEHSLPKSKEILEAARQAEEKIAEIVDAALKKEPDFFRSDDLLEKLTSLFEGKTGQPYEASKLNELCKNATERYLRKIPPGYKDDKKGDPDKFGDAIIWFQLLDVANLSKKPLVFITRDAKEDWWLQHNGETIGPRPELGQEMKQTAGVQFYMYTTPRFLEFAQQFFDLKPEPTKKATTEIKEIEKKEKQAAEHQITAWVAESMQFDPLTSYGASAVATRSTGWQPAATSYGGPAVSIRNVPWQPEATTFVNYPTFSTVSPEEEAAKNTYLQLLPINGQLFNSSAGGWTCEITGTPSPVATDRACYQLRFEPTDRIRTPKHLKLWVSVAGLHHDPDWMYKKAIFRVISDWLGSGNSPGEIMYFS